MTSAFVKVTTAAAFAAAMVGTGWRVSGQGTPSFEVASVKPNKSGDGRMAIGIQPGGRFVASNVPLRELIRFAYQLQPFQIVDVPSWIGSDRFDINAKAEGDQPLTAPIGAAGAPGPLQLMMRALLAERFALKAHRETREMPIYNLVFARPDRKPGEKLQPSSIDCDSVNAAARRGAPPPAPAGSGQRPQCGIRFGPGSLAAGGVTLTAFANTISPVLQRVVIDKTGLTGNFDFDLQWTPDQLPQGPPATGAPAPPPVDPNGPTIFTALQEQLGLKLDSGRAPVDVLVIDSVQPPTAD